jgi:RHS repeat-associated protein
VNAGVVLDDQRPKLAGGGTADAAVPANVGGLPVVLDLGGRVTSLRGTTFVWNRDGTLSEVDEPVPALAETYGVDARGRRYSRMLGGVVQEYYAYEGQDRVAVVGRNGADANGFGIAGPVLESYLFDGIDHPLRIKIAATSTTAYYELDLAGNVRGLRASGGASLGGYRYSGFGQTLEDTSRITQPLRWKGRWFSPVAGGTYDVRARQWSPELGVFLSIDEFQYLDQTSSLWGWPHQSPVRFRDPTGRGWKLYAACLAANWLNPLASVICAPELLKPDPGPPAPPPDPPPGPQSPYRRPADRPNYPSAEDCKAIWETVYENCMFEYPNSFFLCGMKADEATADCKERNQSRGSQKCPMPLPFPSPVPLPAPAPFSPPIPAW